MLTVIKRSGREEPFSIEKIRNTLAAASDELGQPLNKSDLHMLSADVETKTINLDTITSREIFNLVIATLREAGFSGLADAYESNMRNHYQN